MVTPGVWGQTPSKRADRPVDERASHAICEGLRSSPELCVRTHVSKGARRPSGPDIEWSAEQIRLHRNPCAT